jgi:hypothetical protein
VAARSDDGCLCKLANPIVGWKPVSRERRPDGSRFPDGTTTREDAEHDALSAIAFALEGDPQDYDTDAESLTFDVNVTPAA